MALHLPRAVERANNASNKKIQMSARRNQDVCCMWPDRPLALGPSQCPENGGASGTGGTSPSGTNFAFSNPDGDGNEPRVSRVNWTFVNGWDMVGDYMRVLRTCSSPPQMSPVTARSNR